MKAGSNTRTGTENPKSQIGSTKLPLHLVNGLTVAYTAVGLANGKLKYGKGNYMATPVIASIYLDAMERHLASFKAGEEVDPDDGVPHIAAILANCDIILNARAMGTLIDDRGIGTGYLKERDKLTEIYQSLVKLHEDKNPKHYTLEGA